MSRNNNNNVRGPTSALTEFLKASGITFAAQNRRARNNNNDATNAQEQQQVQNQNQEQGQQQPTTASISASNGEDVEMADADADGASVTASQGHGQGQGGTIGSSPSSSRRRSTRRSTVGIGSSSLSVSMTPASGYHSDDLDDHSHENDAEADETSSPAKKRKLSKAAEAKLKAKANAKAKGKGKKKHNEDEDDDGEEADPYNALSTMWTRNNTNNKKPPVGNFIDCAECQKQFTVTKYTLSATPGPGFLCHPCGKSSGVDPFKIGSGSGAKRRTRAPVDKRTVIHFEERRFPSLASLCIQMITKHINDIEALGDIGAINMESISKALAKNRGLTPENAHLFYNITNTQLTLHDATNLLSPALQTLFHLNPNLTRLRLDFCGHLDDEAMRVLSRNLLALTHLELLGPFLVRSEGWREFFESRGDGNGATAKGAGLCEFGITQSPRFDVDCMKALRDSSGSNGTLKVLRLREVEKLDDEFLEVIGGCVGLEELDIAGSGLVGNACSEDSLISLLQLLTTPTTTTTTNQHCGQLKKLNLSRHAQISDTTLLVGLKDSLHLTSLTLEHLPLLTDEGVQAFFEGWGNEPLSVVEMSRNWELGGGALGAILRHSGGRLEVLGISGWGGGGAGASGEVAEADSEAGAGAGVGAAGNGNGSGSGGGGVGMEALRMVGKLGGELRKLDVGWVREVDDFIVREWVEGIVDDEEEVAGNGVGVVVSAVPPAAAEESGIASGNDKEGNGKRRIGGCPRLAEVKVWGCNKVTARCLRKKGISIYGVESHAAL